MAGQLVDRVVVTIAPVFLQGYNVLARKADGRDASSLGGSGEETVPPTILVPLWCPLGSAYCRYSAGESSPHGWNPLFYCSTSTRAVMVPL